MNVLWSEVPCVSANWRSIFFKTALSQELDSDYSYWIKVIYYLDLIFIIPVTFFLSHCFYFLSSLSLFHKNVSIILYFVIFWLMFSLIPRIYILLLQLKILFVGDSNFALLISSFLIFQFYGNSIACIPIVGVERTIATFFFYDYEKNQRLWLNCIFLPAIFIVGQILAVPITFLNTPLIVPLGFTTTVVVFSSIFLNVLYISNYRKLQKIRRESMLYTLSKKYQLEENLRVMWFLRFMGILYSLGIIFLFCMFIIPWETIFPFRFGSMCSIFYFFDPLITLCGALFPIYCYITLFYAKHPGFLRKINKTSRSRSNTIAISDETNFYFKQLTESWK